MTPHELKRLFPNASASTLARNCGAPQGAEPESPIRHRTNGKVSRAPTSGPRCLVRITSYRKRLLDPDNLAVTYFVNAIRRAGIVPDDSAAIMALTVSQQKAAAERTEIEIVTL